MMMRSSEKVKEFLRPFVDSKAWDFCIIWKLGDDPSRFIEWFGCCCSGCFIDKSIKLKKVEEEEEIEIKKEATLCRDEHKKHNIRTLACESLSHFPLFMPLYPGIHGEVVMSKSPKWLFNSSPGSKKDVLSTRVLVPVSDGLIELFSFIMIPFDESLVDLIISRCNAFCKPFPEQTLQFRIIPRPEESISSGMNLSFEYGGGGSSSVSNPTSETQNLKEEQARYLALNKMEDPFEFKANKKEHFKSKNLHSERKRRERINKGLLDLRAIVPKVTKMNRVGTLSDAIDYINELLVEKQKLEDELKGIECRKITESEKVSTKLNKKVKKNEMNLEVHEIGERNFMIRVAQEDEGDGFKRLIEAVDSCELEIVNVSFTRLNLTVMSVLNVKANKDGIASGNLRDLLLKMMITSENP